MLRFTIARRCSFPSPLSSRLSTRNRPATIADSPEPESCGCRALDVSPPPPSLVPVSPGSVSEFAAGGRLRPKQRRLLHRVGCPNFRPSSLVLPSRRFPNLHAISGPPAGRRHGPIRVVLYDRRSAHQYGAAIFITYHPISKTDTHAFLTSRLIYIVRLAVFGGPGPRAHYV